MFSLDFLENWPKDIFVLKSATSSDRDLKRVLGVSIFNLGSIFPSD